MTAAAVTAVRHGSSDEDYIRFALCREFGWLPSEMDGEDWLLMYKFTEYLSIINKLERAEMEKVKAKKPRGRH